jgi:hypothetical protein
MNAGVHVTSAFLLSAVLVDQRGFLSLERTLVDVEKRGVSKGGLDTPCSLVFARVHFVLETPMFCSLRAIDFRWCSPALLYGLLYKQTLYSSV